VVKLSTVPLYHSPADSHKISTSQPTSSSPAATVAFAAGAGAGALFGFFLPAKKLASVGCALAACLLGAMGSVVGEKSGSAAGEDEPMQL
jgi:hypothetical protein